MCLGGLLRLRTTPAPRVRSEDHSHRFSQSYFMRLFVKRPMVANHSANNCLTLIHYCDSSPLCRLLYFYRALFLICGAAGFLDLLACLGRYSGLSYRCFRHLSSLATILEIILPDAGSGIARNQPDLILASIRKSGPSGLHSVAHCVSPHTRSIWKEASPHGQMF